MEWAAAQGKVRGMSPAVSTYAEGTFGEAAAAVAASAFFLLRARALHARRHARAILVFPRVCPRGVKRGEDCCFS